MKNNKLESLRQWMRDKNLDAYILPSTDAHQSEYIAEHWQARTWISGFTGSAGVIAITQDFAGLWTDGRYFLQAETELEGTGIELVKLKMAHAPEYINWLLDNLTVGTKIGIDTNCLSVSTVAQMKTAFAEKQQELVAANDMLDTLWTDRPSIPTNPIYEHILTYAGKSRLEKLGEVRAAMTQQGATHHLITSLDDIAWLLNIRGTDVDYNPVAICFLMVGLSSVTLHIDDKKTTIQAKQELLKDNITLAPYIDIARHVQSLPNGACLLIDPSRVNQYLYEQIPSYCSVIKGMNPSTSLKAIKNETECNHIRSVMVKDGIALVKFLRWLENNLGKQTITEIDASDKLEAFRKAQPHFVSNSFSTISGYKGHGAIIHYRSTDATNVALKKEGVYLLDSGGQYLDGTTDITRTLALGEPTAEQKRDYTLVLKGHINVGKMKFVKGTSGNQIDAMARQALWSYGLDYKHGTGHGVGFFLNVHEGPQRIGSGSTGAATIPFEAGMFTSNEPGYYKTGEYGIRIENLILTVEGKETEYGQFLEFETVTLCPIDTTLIEVSLLAEEEKAWFNAYHARVFERLSVHLEESETAWLKGKTVAI